MPKTYDLDSIDPARRTEVARRISVLDRYVAIGLPDADADASYAAEIGVGVAQCLRLARVWRRHGPPELLPGALPRSVGGRIHSWRLGTGCPDASGAAALLLDLPPGGAPTRTGSVPLERIRNRNRFGLQAGARRTGTRPRRSDRGLLTADRREA